ncbi:MAG: hypothetical protein HY459_02865 [Parcubacteria group bacterium]|nr:hypothetical protein [Parcubacteria group bacterium]
MTPQVDQDIKRQLCELTKLCPICLGVTWVNRETGLPANTPEKNDKCGKCNSTGRVPLLDPTLVRVPCTTAHLWRVIQDKDGYLDVSISCEKVGCPGYTPSDDPWAYVKAYCVLGNPDHESDILGAIEIVIDDWFYNRLDQDPGPAALAVVAEALLGKGAAGGWRRSDAN